ncbi:hypothetical protein [Sinorhizobium sp. BG8]|uniref:hypothetical protein n=1 Tax=Sinorhizobium sp. BG8 TaxID=2613773 RepID=UPI00193EA843|nr:hypothetical protein [Sinorhizobium sp. BG8]QRM55591.1 hypothetical protein F3Y30_14465 [Sinorhizobium sp. BG8]
MKTAFLRVVATAITLLAAVVLPAHSKDAAGALKDIRKVEVSGDASVSAGVVKAAARQLKQSVRSTRRPVALEKVAMDVQLSSMRRSGGGRNSAQVTVRLIDLGGRPVARETMTVNSFMPDPKAADRALAQAVAQRVALAYRLTQPQADVNSVRSKGTKGKYVRKTRSTNVAQQTQAYQANTQVDDIIIPTEAALTVRSRARPVEKAAGPCVVTAEKDCK